MVTRNKKGFSLLEVFFIFLTLAIFLTAFSPMLSKKTKPIAENNRHGVYRCYYDTSGVLHEEMFSGGQHLKSGSPKDGKCSFAPPNKVTLFKVDLYSGASGGVQGLLIRNIQNTNVNSDFTMANGFSSTYKNIYREITDDELKEQLNGKTVILSKNSPNAANGGDVSWKVIKETSNSQCSITGQIGIDMEEMEASKNSYISTLNSMKSAIQSGPDKDMVKFSPEGKLSSLYKIELNNGVTFSQLSNPDLALAYENLEKEAVNYVANYQILNDIQSAAKSEESSFFANFMPKNGIHPIIGSATDKQIKKACTTLYSDYVQQSQLAASETLGQKAIGKVANNAKAEGLGQYYTKLTDVITFHGGIGGQGGNLRLVYNVNHDVDAPKIKFEDYFKSLNKKYVATTIPYNNAKGATKSKTSGNLSEGAKGADVNVMAAFDTPKKKGDTKQLTAATGGHGAVGLIQYSTEIAVYNGGKAKKTSASAAPQGPQGQEERIGEDATMDSLNVGNDLDNALADAQSRKSIGERIGERAGVRGGGNCYTGIDGIEICSSNFIDIIQYGSAGINGANNGTETEILKEFGVFDAINPLRAQEGSDQYLLNNYISSLQDKSTELNGKDATWKDEGNCAETTNAGGAWAYSLYSKCENKVQKPKLHMESESYTREHIVGTPGNWGKHAKFYQTDLGFRCEMTPGKGGPVLDIGDINGPKKAEALKKARDYDRKKIFTTTISCYDRHNKKVYDASLDGIGYNLNSVADLSMSKKHVWERKITRYGQGPDEIDYVNEFITDPNIEEKIELGENATAAQKNAQKAQETIESLKTSLQGALFKMVARVAKQSHLKPLADYKVATRGNGTVIKDACSYPKGEFKYRLEQEGTESGPLGDWIVKLYLGIFDHGKYMGVDCYAKREIRMDDLKKYVSDTGENPYQVTNATAGGGGAIVITW